MSLPSTFRTDHNQNSNWRSDTSKVAGFNQSVSTPTSAYGVSKGGYSGDYYSQLQSIYDTNNAFNLAQVDMVNAFNHHEAQLNRDWQERMSNTAHQREVSDLLAAGLNPVLSAGGQGAVTGSGAVAQGQKAVADNTLGSGFISLMSSMISAASAQNVASIYAAANMYGSDKSYEGQMAYVKQLQSNGLINTLGRLVGDVFKFISPKKNVNIYN